MLRLVNVSSQIDINLNTLRDVGILDLFQFCMESKNEIDILQFINQYCTYDGSEIEARNGKLLALIKIPNVMSEFRKIITTKNKLQYFQKRLYNPNERLRFCVNTINIFECLIESVKETVSFFSLSDDFTFKDVKAEMNEFINSPDFIQSVELLSKINDSFKMPKELMLGVNVEGDYTADAFGVIGVINSDKNLGAEPIFDTTSVKRTREIGVLERRIINQLENQYRKKSNQTFKYIKLLHYDIVDKWVSFLNDFEFYLNGIKLYTLLDKKNYKQTCPVIDNAELSIDQLVNPLLAISLDERISPISVNCKNDMVVIISGINQSGKTTLIKSIAQSMILSQLGFLVPSKKFAMKPQKSFYSLFSSGESKNLTESRFQVELDIYDHIKAILKIQAWFFLTNLLRVLILMKLPILR